MRFHFLMAGEIDEGRVQKVVGLARQQLQRIALRGCACAATPPAERTTPPDPCRTRSGFRRRYAPCHSAWQSRWQRAATACRFRRRSSSGARADRASSRSRVMPCQLRHARRQRGIDHRVDALAEAFVLEAHAQRQLAKELHVRFALAQRRDRLMRHLQIVVAVSL